MLSRLPCVFQKVQEENRKGRKVHNSTCVLTESTFAGFTIIPLFILMGVFNQWIRLYLKLRSNCRCNCSAPMLTTVRIQTKTHCEWPKVPRYPLHQHTCPRFPLGIPWQRQIQCWITCRKRYLEKGVQGASRPFHRKFKPDHLTFR